MKRSEYRKEIAALGVKVKGYASNAANFEDTEKVVNQIKDDLVLLIFW